ncbi:SRPBCC family protein [Rhizobium giardinii]|jgi:uncharacterized protein YndB with AHSA1/START domain|uniref:Uncharacterized protein YndB with AHSA1/START domain n=1 Tax=Rhizobium giardinii TaxID=56731 RepID=A0A7W8U7F0_9HYPH|nr:SRPBCC family protein [Rhizobium giardinii]MBB5534239.1 uncharacterized protein YndB with AHSA1/START domain [Rhizobium giardinii]
MSLVESIPVAEFGVINPKDTVRIERLLPGPIERIWAYLTEEQKRRQWMAAGPIELRAGGTVRHLFDNSRLTARDDRPPAKYAAHAGPMESHGTVITCDPPRLLVYTWAEETGEPSEVRFDLAEQGSKVLLTVSHSRILSRDAMLSFAAGWHTHLDILADRLNDREPSLFWPKHTALEAEYGKRVPAA